MLFHSLNDLDTSTGTVQLHAQATHHRRDLLVLHPRPNPSDPNDPLRWPQWKKYLCFSCVCLFSCLGNFGIGGMAPAFYVLSLEFQKSQNETTGLLLWPILVLGIFNFLWIPLGNFFGKRLVFVFATLLLSLAYLWGALAESFESLLWSGIVAAFAGSAGEAVVAAVVNDVFFLHERANLMSWALNALAVGNDIGPLICGFIITGTSWRVHKWLSFGLSTLNFLMVVFFFPETRYSRSYLDEPNSARKSSDSPATKNSISPSPFDLKSHDPIQPTPQELSSSQTDTPDIPQLPKRTWLQEMSLWSGIPHDTNFLVLILRPFPLMVYPAVILAFLGYAVSLAWVVAINVLYSFTLGAPPYSFSPSIYGLINIPILIGNIFGQFVGGWVTDYYSDWCSRRNYGVFQPETRLHLLVVPGVLVPAGCLLYGYGVGETLSWVALFFGAGLVGIGLTAVPSMTMTYVSDIYLPVNAEALALVVGFKNVVAFGCLYAIVPWISAEGYINSFGAQAGIFVGIMLLAVSLIIWGPRIRHATAKWRVIL